jgi:hypothetical protein
LEAIKIATIAKYKELEPLHKCSRDTLPYAKTHALPLVNVRNFERPIPYQKHIGAIGWVRFEALPSPQPGPISESDSQNSDLQSSLSELASIPSTDTPCALSDCESMSEGMLPGGTATPLAFHPRRRYPRKMPPRPEEAPRYPVYRPNGSDDSDREPPSLPDPEALMEQRAAALRDRLREANDPLFVYDSDSAAEMDRFEEMLGGLSNDTDADSVSVSETSSQGGPDLGWFDGGLLSDAADSEMSDDWVDATDELSDEGIASSGSSETMSSEDAQDSEAADEDALRACNEEASC